MQNTIRTTDFLSTVLSKGKIYGKEEPHEFLNRYRANPKLQEDYEAKKIFEALTSKASALSGKLATAKSHLACLNSVVSLLS